MDAKRFVAVICASMTLLAEVRAQGSSLAPPPSAPSLASPLSGPSTQTIVTDPMVVPVPQAAPGAPVGAAQGFSSDGYAMPGVTNWIRRDNGVCCNGPFGKHPEVGQELYFRSGVSLPTGNELLTRNATTGFTVEGGARTLFYNQQYTRAWIVDTGIVNSYNSGIANPEKITINGLRPGVVGFQDFTVSVRNVNRTMVNLGLGHEWFMDMALNNPAHLRFGLDGGGRYGTEKVSLNEITHRTDVIGGLYLGAQALYEFGCRNSILNVGVRTEYAYTFSDIFQRQSDFGEVNILATFGVRY